MAAKVKLSEIAARIRAHLKRMEADPAINVRIGGKMGLSRYYLAGSCASGNRIFLSYINFQGQSSLKREAALEYLAWLDAGNNGTSLPMREKGGRTMRIGWPGIAFMLVCFGLRAVVEWRRR